MTTPLVRATTTTDVHGFFTQIFPGPVLALRDPAGTDTGYEVGQLWINQTGGANTVWFLTSYAAGAAVWSQVFP